MQLIKYTENVSLVGAPVITSFEDIASRLLGYEDKFVRHFLDPIHGQVGVTEIELSTMRTNVFSRLKDIKQLGFVSNIYPSATHTRFEHSIGTLFVTWEMLKRFAKNHAQRSRAASIEDFPDVLIQATRLSALLHDLGHGPYSHGIEEVFKYLGMKFDHDEITNYLLTHDLPDEAVKSVAPNIHTALSAKRIGKLNQFRKELSKIKQDMRESVLGILNTKYELISSEPAGFSQLRYFLHDLLKGDIGSDRIDYLLRDTYFTGLGHRFSLSEILDNINAIYDHKRNRLLFAIQHDGRDAVELLLLTRYFHYQFIAHHPENVSQIINLIPRLENHLLKKKNRDRKSEITLIRVALETDWIERVLPSPPRFKELYQIRLSEINNFPLRYLLYRIMVDQKFRKILLYEIELYLSDRLESFSSDDVIFFFSGLKPHIPKIHVLFDEYVRGGVKKSVLIHDQSPFLVGLGRAYIGNSSLIIYARGRTYDELKDFLKREPHFYMKYRIVQKVMQQLDKQNLSDYDLLLFALMEISNDAEESFKGVGKAMRVYKRLKRSSLDPTYEFSDGDVCYDPYRKHNFDYPQNIFNDLLLFDVCKMFRMEITNVFHKGIFRSSWEFTPCRLRIYSKKQQREVLTRPVRILVRDFYPKEIVREKSSIE